MTSVSSAGASFLQSSSTSGSNWVQDAATASSSNGSDWMSPSAGPDALSLAANAFAAAEQIKTSNLNSLAVNEGISLLQTQLAGHSVNILA